MTRNPRRLALAALLALTLAAVAPFATRPPQAHADIAGCDLMVEYTFERTGGTGGIYSCDLGVVLNCIHVRFVWGDLNVCEVIGFEE